MVQATAYSGNGCVTTPSRELAHQMVANSSTHASQRSDTSQRAPSGGSFMREVSVGRISGRGRAEHSAALILSS